MDPTFKRYLTDNLSIEVFKSLLFDDYLNEQKHFDNLDDRDKDNAEIKYHLRQIHRLLYYFITNEK